MRTPHALTTDQRGFEVEEDCSTVEVEVNGFKFIKAIANCNEAAIAEVNAPSKVDEKAPREVGTSQRSNESLINSLANTTANPSVIGKKNESRTLGIVIKRNESKREDERKTFFIVISFYSRYDETRTLVTAAYAEEESGYAVKSVPIEADPRKPHAQGVRRSV